MKDSHTIEFGFTYSELKFTKRIDIEKHTSGIVNIIHSEPSIEYLQEDFRTDKYQFDD